jgi:threonine dehydrogenase-like Zn-dependent dehydrogenase
VRALVFQGPWQIGVEERPDPVPGAREALLRVVATGICGSDLHGYTGENGRRVSGQVMGHETVARVMEVGRDAVQMPGVVPGALVTFNPVIGCGTCTPCLAGRSQQCDARRVIGVNPEILAGMAEFTAVPAANLVVLPDTMPARLGQTLNPNGGSYMP